MRQIKVRAHTGSPGSDFVEFVMELAILDWLLFSVQRRSIKELKAVGIEIEGDIDDDDMEALVFFEGGVRLCPCHQNSLSRDACTDGFNGCEIEQIRK